MCRHVACSNAVVVMTDCLDSVDLAAVSIPPGIVRVPSAAHHPVQVLHGHPVRRDEGGEELRLHPKLHGGRCASWLHKRISCMSGLPLSSPHKLFPMLHTLRLCPLQIIDVSISM